MIPLAYKIDMYLAKLRGHENDVSLVSYACKKVEHIKLCARG